MLNLDIKGDFLLVHVLVGRIFSRVSGWDWLGEGAGVGGTASQGHTQLTKHLKGLGEK